MKMNIPDLALIAVLLATWPAGSVAAGEAAAPLQLRAAAVEDLDRVTGLGIDPTENLPEMQATSSTAAPSGTDPDGAASDQGGPETVITRTLSGTNGIGGSAFAGASGLVTSIQNMGDNVTIHNITNVTVNIR